MKLSLIDLHCDTVYEMYTHHKAFEDPSLAINLRQDLTDVYEAYWQIVAIWSDSQLSDEEAFEQCLRILSLLKSNAFSSANRLICAVEDARILADKIDRLRLLYQKGVRFLTLLWKGKSCIGGAYDTDIGLTSFGKQVIDECGRLGMVVDISHASVRSAYEILECSIGRPVIASHSDSFTVCPHPRNLIDELFVRIKQSGGLVGINLYTEHLGVNARGDSAIDTVLCHIEHFLSLGGEDILCFGCDFDGAATPPMLRHPKDLTVIAEEMLRRGYPQIIIEKLFWKNAKHFIAKNILI